MLTESQSQLIQVLRAYNIGGALVIVVNAFVLGLYGLIFGLISLVPSEEMGSNIFSGTLGLVFLIPTIILTFVCILQMVASIFLKRKSIWVWYFQLVILFIGSINLFMFYCMPISIYLFYKFIGDEYKNYYRGN